jgi:hypothetical protein
MKILPRTTIILYSGKLTVFFDAGPYSMDEQCSWIHKEIL